VCGIAAIVGTVDEHHRRALARMADAMAHRGPDGEGFWESDVDAEGRGCLLAHRRLSILDLTAAADQPMTDPVGGQTFVFNGEIYNFAALRSGLQAAGHSFTSTGDTAVMLRMLAERGLQACADLRGMFAFVLWDPHERCLLIGRDPHGIKPLYVAANPDAGGAWSLVVASEVRALLASGLLDRPRLDPAAVASVVWNGYVMGPGTVVAGVHALAAGEARRYDGRGRLVESKSFWSIPGPSDGAPASAAELAAVLQQTVAEHLVSDVPLGVFLSGGIDSSAVANLAQRARGDDRVTTFALAFEEARYDESPHARAVAEAIGTDHHEIRLSEATFVRDLDAAIDTIDQPTFDGLNSYFMSRAVREAGVTVALVGTGGDELFGGYETFRRLPRLLDLARRSRPVPAAVKRAAARAVSTARQRGAGPVAPQSRWAKLPAMVDAGEDVLALYQLSYALFLPAFQRELLGPEAEAAAPALGLAPSLRTRLEEEIRGRSHRSALSALEQRCFLGERLLPDTDAASMAVSLELRVPLVDHVLTACANRLDDATRYLPAGRKQALRDAGLAGLDPALFERPKRGFELPFDRWIRQNLGQAMDEVMADRAASAAVGLDADAVTRLWRAFQDGAPGIYWSRVWALYVLIRWCHRHGVLLT
jgi:asparagine synthase (glutamine-hydrolysing)